MKMLPALLLAIATLDASAASFDCRKAKSTVEKLVCADPALSKLDERLAAISRKVSADDWDTVYNGQTEWLRDPSVLALTEAGQRAVDSYDPTDTSREVVCDDRVSECEINIATVPQSKDVIKSGIPTKSGIQDRQ